MIGRFQIGQEKMREAARPVLKAVGGGSGGARRPAAKPAGQWEEF